MSLLWIDGCETAELAPIKYQVNLGTPGTAIATATSRANSGNCYALLSSSATSQRLFWNVPSAVQGDAYTVGFMYQFNSTTWDTSGIWQTMFQVMNDAGSIHLAFIVTGAGEVQVFRSTGSIATSTGAAWSTGVSKYIEIQFVIHDSTGSVIVRVDGVEVLNFSGDTRNGGTTANVTQFMWGAPDVNSTTSYVDDIYILDDAGSDYNTFLGDIRVETIRPNANGSSSDFTGSDGNSTDNYALVDDTTYDAADYVESSTSTHRDMYGHGDLARTSGTVRGVMAFTVAQKTDSGSKDLQHSTRVGSTNYDGASKALLGSGGPVYTVWEKNPSTTADWLISEVNAAQFGYEVV